MVVCTHNLSHWKTVAGESLSSRSAWSRWQVSGKPGLRREILSQKEEEEETPRDQESPCCLFSHHRRQAIKSILQHSGLRNPTTRTVRSTFLFKPHCSIVVDVWADQHPWPSQESFGEWLARRGHSTQLHRTECHSRIWDTDTDSWT